MTFLYRIWGLRKFVLIAENTVFNLRYKNLFGNKVNIFGYPMIFTSKGAKMRFGKDTTLISSAYFNEVGISHPVIIRLLDRNAVLTVGDRVGMSGGCICVKSEVSIGNDVLLGANVSIVDNDFHPIDPLKRKDKKFVHSKKVTIGNNVFIGMNTTVLRGVTIGENSVVGAGSIVTSDIPPNQVWGGCPAKFIRNL